MAMQEVSRVRSRLPHQKELVTQSRSPIGLEGLGHRPFTGVTRVRISLGATSEGLGNLALFRFCTERRRTVEALIPQFVNPRHEQQHPTAIPKTTSPEPSAQFAGGVKNYITPNGSAS